MPTTSQVAAIWVNDDYASAERRRDVIVFGKSGSSYRSMSYCGCYDPLQYPLLFPYGEMGWHEGIKKKYQRFIIKLENRIS